MALNLSLAAIVEKNKIASSGAFLVLLEMVIPNDDGGYTIRVVQNNEDIIWNGYTWQAFPFQLGDIEENSKSMPNFTLNICNIGGEIQEYLEATSGGVGASVILRVVHSDHLDLTTAEVEETFYVTKTTSTAKWVTFTLGGDFGLNKRVTNIYLKDFCTYQFKGIECGYNGALTACSHNYSTCRIASRFGGEIEISGGIYV